MSSSVHDCPREAPLVQIEDAFISCHRIIVAYSSHYLDNTFTATRQPRSKNVLFCHSVDQKRINSTFKRYTTATFM